MFENVGAFPHTPWSNGSSLIDWSCLFKLQRDFPVPLSSVSVYTDFFYLPENTFSLLLHLIQSSSIKSIWGSLLGYPSLAHHLECCRCHCIQCHTHTLRAFFSRLVYKLEQLRFTATSYRPALPWEAQRCLVTL